MKYDPQVYLKHASILGFFDAQVEPISDDAASVYGRLPDPDSDGETMARLGINLPTSTDFDRYHQRPEVILHVNLRYADSKRGPDWRILRMKPEQFLKHTAQTFSGIVFMIRLKRDTLARIDSELDKWKKARVQFGRDLQQEWKARL